MTRLLLRLARRVVPGRVRRSARTRAVAAWDYVRPPTIEQRFGRLERASGGRLAVAATNLSSGRSVEFRARTAVPLASTVKLALALDVLARVDDGRTSLDAPVPVRPEHGRFGDGALDVLMRDAGGGPVVRTVGELLHLSLVESDNTATDRLFDLSGGPAEVHARVERLGIDGLRVDRAIGQVLAERRRLAEECAGDHGAATRAFLADVRDTTTPAAMVQLLAAIHRGAGLTPASAAHVQALMRGCATSATRIRAGVPAGASVAHKTGTLQRHVTADVGLITMPDGVTIALAIYLTGSAAAGVDRDGAIAGATRLALALVT